jgi:CheY-like chemotaxis protein
MRKILIADDDEAICSLLHALLTEAGFQVTLTHDGAEALEVLKREEGWVLFLDLIMPKTDGHAVLRQLQANPLLLSDTKVILMSSSDHLAREAQRWPGQVVAQVLPKPFDLERVLALARQLSVHVP